MTHRGYITSDFSDFPHMKSCYHGIATGSSDLHIGSLSRAQVLCNIDSIIDLGLLPFVDLKATFKDTYKRRAPRIKDDWSWASRL